MDMSIILTVAGIIVAVIGSNLALVLWARSESRADHRALESWTKDMLSAIQSEMKDFHGRLCSLESRYHNDRNNNG